MGIKSKCGMQAVFLSSPTQYWPANGRRNLVWNKSENIYTHYHKLTSISLTNLYTGRDMKIIDGDSNEVVERFPVTLIHQPTAFNHHNHIYDNILIFTVQHPDEPQGTFYFCPSLVSSPASIFFLWSIFSVSILSRKMPCWERETWKNQVRNNYYCWYN